jgi:hypothetical protein
MIHFNYGSQPTSGGLGLGEAGDVWGYPQKMPVGSRSISSIN